MKKKNLIFILIFIIVFSILYGKDYYIFHNNQKSSLDIVNEIKEKNSFFSIDNINTIEYIDLFSTPDKGLLEDIVGIIDNAKEYIYIEMYMFTEKRIMESIIRAHLRGVEIKIILENEPYLAHNINNKVYEDLSEKGIQVVWSNKKNYIFNHTKLLIIDDLIILSTGNLTYSTFTKNKDLFLFIKDELILNGIIEIFNNDYSGIKKFVENPNILLSPYNSRDKINKLLESANKNIKIYIPYIKDPEIIQKIIKIKKDKGIDINIIIPKDIILDEEIKLLYKEGIHFYKIPKYKLHSKAILIDDNYLYIGSINFSENSLDKNREIGIITKEKNIIEKFNQIFELDIIK